MKPISWEPLSPIQVSALRPGRRLNGRKPATASASASEITSTSLESPWIAADEAKNAAEITARLPASPSMLSSRLKAFVIPTSQKSADRDREPGAVHDLDVRAGREDDRGASELRGDLGERRQRADVVDQACEEEQARSGEDPDELAARLERPECDGEPHPGAQADVDPHPADEAALRHRASDSRRASARARARGGSGAAPRRRSVWPGKRRVPRGCSQAARVGRRC